jgi:hypothetical protein
MLGKDHLPECRLHISTGTTSSVGIDIARLSELLLASVHWTRRHASFGLLARVWRSLVGTVLLTRLAWLELIVVLV